MDKKEDSQDLQSSIVYYQQGKLDSAYAILTRLFTQGSMKAGCYMALINLKKASKRGDIASKVALGNLYEFGLGTVNDLNKATLSVSFS